MREYKVETDRRGNNIISYEENGVLYSFVEDPANSDYQRYLRWLENPDAEDNGGLIND
jgi:hypothetical protein